MLLTTSDSMRFCLADSQLDNIRIKAEQGDANSQYQLGRMYDRGQGVAQNYAEAAIWYLKAAEQGYAQAQTNLGILYQNGRGIAQDYGEALKWYRKAADQGDTDAQRKVERLHKLEDTIWWNKVFNFSMIMTFTVFVRSIWWRFF